jgi:hypothetical protein
MGCGGAGQGGGREVDLEEPSQKGLITFTTEGSLFSICGDFLEGKLSKSVKQGGLCSVYNGGNGADGVNPD